VLAKLEVDRAAADGQRLRRIDLHVEPEPVVPAVPRKGEGPVDLTAHLDRVQDQGAATDELVMVADTTRQSPLSSDG
jgi:hypothetical protein